MTANATSVAKPKTSPRKALPPMGLYPNTLATYRTAAKTKALLPCFEDRVVAFRQAIPGPLRRLFGALLFVPIHIVSFALAILVGVASWIIWADFEKFWAIQGVEYQGRGHYERLALLRGTNALYGYDDPEFYPEIREGILTTYPKIDRSGGY